MRIHVSKVGALRVQVQTLNIMWSSLPPIARGAAAPIRFFNAISRPPPARAKISIHSHTPASCCHTDELTPFAFGLLRADEFNKILWRLGGSGNAQATNLQQRKHDENSRSTNCSACHDYDSAV